MGLCWGQNERGQLGDGSTADRYLPGRIGSGEIKWISIDVGGVHSCGVSTDRKGYCWGDNEYAELAVILDDYRTYPVSITRKSKEWSLLTAGFGFSCGIALNGTGYCWGSDFNGELGSNPNGDLVREIASDQEWISLFAGASHTCGIATDGKGYCWGLNADGQLGDGTITERDFPVAIVPQYDWVSLSCGSSSTCGITTDGTGYCWGYNQSLPWGQVDDDYDYQDGSSSDNKSDLLPVKVTPYRSRSIGQSTDSDGGTAIGGGGVDTPESLSSQSPTVEQTIGDMPSTAATNNNAVGTEVGLSEGVAASISPVTDAVGIPKDAPNSSPTASASSVPGTSPLNSPNEQSTIGMTGPSTIESAELEDYASRRSTAGSPLQGISSDLGGTSTSAPLTGVSGGLEDTSGSGSADTGLIVGVVVGGIVAVCVFGVVGSLWYIKRRKENGTIEGRQAFRSIQDVDHDHSSPASIQQAAMLFPPSKPLFSFSMLSDARDSIHNNADSTTTSPSTRSNDVNVQDMRLNGYERSDIFNDDGTLLASIFRESVRSGRILSSPASLAYGSNHGHSSRSQSIVGSRTVDLESRADRSINSRSLGSIGAFGIDSESDSGSEPRRMSPQLRANPFVKVFQGNEFDLIQPIGEGSFGKVFRARWRQTDVAIKILTDNSAVLSISDHHQRLREKRIREEMIREALLMAQLRHPNILQFIGICESPASLITEYCARGSLMSLLHEAKEFPSKAAELTWARRLSLLADAARGVLYLHSNNRGSGSPNPVLHCDLKSPNILVS